MKIDWVKKLTSRKFWLSVASFVSMMIVACGGTEIDGIDFIFAAKILRKFESLGMGFIRDEIDGLITYLDHVFGEENMQISKNYLLRLKKMSMG